MNIPAPQDPLTMVAQRLGEAKTKAASKGMVLLGLFDEIQKEIEELKIYGIDVASVDFEDKAIQAAWTTHRMKDWIDLEARVTEGEMPLMTHEDVLVRRHTG